MFGWFAFAILATFLMTCVNFGDKFIIESQVPDPLALIIYLSFFNLAIGAILWFMIGFEMIPLAQTGLLILSGTSPAFAGFFYFQAVSKSETTRIVILSQMLPIFTLILGAIFLQETLAPVQLIGFFMILIAAIAVSLERTPENEETVTSLAPKWEVLGLMMMTNLIYAGAFVLTDSLVETLVTDIPSLTLVTAYTSFGYWIGGMILFLLLPSVRKAFLNMLPKTGTKALLSLSGVESIFVLRQFVIFLALSLGPVSLVSVVGSLNVFFAIILGIVLTLWQPHIFRENLSRDSLTKKFLWAAVAFVGIILI